MCDETNDLDVIMYECINDCDSVKNEEYQEFHIQEQEQEQEHENEIELLKEEEEEEEEELEEQFLEADANENENEHGNDSDSDYILPTDIEALEDEYIPADINLQPMGKISKNKTKHYDVEVEKFECEVNDEELVTKRRKNKGPQRYMLYDDLVASVVDYDEEGTPIVQFSIPKACKDDYLPIECGICPDVMKKSKLAKHLETHLVPGTNRYKCMYCEDTYKDYKYLASHSRRHMGIRPYVCEICKIYFSTKQDMRVHNQRRHLKKEHICEICGKTFSQNTMLKRHRESTHEKKRRFQCDHCPKAYYKNFSLQEHVRSVHMGQRRMLKCPFCGMQCLDAHKMARHRKLWHLNQTQFECEICNEKFTDVHYFDAHKRSIQCRNNTRRKNEEIEKQQTEQKIDEVENNDEQVIDEVEQQQQQPQPLFDIVLKNEMTDEQPQCEVQDEQQQQVAQQWQMVDDENGGIVEAFDDCDQFVVDERDLMQNNETLFHQDGNVLFEIIFDPEETNVQC